MEWTVQRNFSNANDESLLDRARDVYDRPFQSCSRYVYSDSHVAR